MMRIVSRFMHNAFCIMFVEGGQGRAPIADSDYPLNYCMYVVHVCTSVILALAAFGGVAGG
jgi:hypothetical protein